MYSIRLILSLLVVSWSSHALNIHDIFPEDVVREARLGEHNEDFGLNIIQFLEKYGYPIESHEVTTEDGYILTMHRIPHGRNETGILATSTKKPAVFLMHGLLCSSMDWVNAGPTRSLALNLADAGYDVWLGNNRGNTWSRKHVVLDPDVDKEFWDYSFDTCGYYDLPAEIDYVLNATGLEKLNYVGHSQGTSEFFALASLRPEYNEKITLMVALAPIAYMQNLTQPLVLFLANYTTLFDIVMEQLGIHEIFPSSPLLVEVLDILCREGSEYQDLCIDLIFFLTGPDMPQMDRSFMEVAISNTPAGISARMLSHYLQEIQSGYFRRYDYGLKNFEIYKQLSPPSYNVSLITSPVALYYARNDRLAAIYNVEQFASELPNLVMKNLIEFELFNHLDFLWATDVKTLVNDDVVALLNNHNHVS
ncbi:hypothetical protein NQ315_007598 [Exocentrus adspersus]|uniref:Lipase n=1 Tax=Exocentrus adspersus TaxID=1586481 RepID=A0AAV8W7E8_9CUCU|nr:hypothetical protein NQ315_007598 [Exocentrus adspersus]